MDYKIIDIEGVGDVYAKKLTEAGINKVSELLERCAAPKGRKELAKATDFCGVRSGRDTDKWKEANLTPIPSSVIKAPMIQESPVNIECKVIKSEELGTHTIFYGKVVAVHVDDKYMDETGRFHFEDTNPLAYSHGQYYTLGENVGKFGFSVRKETKKKSSKKKK